MLPIHEALESLYGPLSSPDNEERAALLALGLKEGAVAELLSKWPDGPAGIGSSQLLDIREIIAFDWQTNTLKVGLLTVGYCANGDPIALDVAAGAPWPVYYISHEHEGLYDDSELTRIRVSEGFQQFLIECDADEDYPWDYFEAEERLGGTASS